SVPGVVPPVSVVSAQPGPAPQVGATDAPALRRAPAAIPADAGTGGTVSVSTEKAAQPVGTSTSMIGGSGWPGTVVNNEYIVDLPPNTPPVANDDTASVDEDGSVIIDVLANDTDE